MSKIIALAVRNGGKGPGREVVRVNEDDVDAAKGLIESTLQDGQNIVVREIETVPVLTVEEFEAKLTAQTEAENKKAEALAKLSDEDRAALGL